MNTIIVTVLGDRRANTAVGKARRLVWLEPTLLNTDDLALAARVLAVRAGADGTYGPLRITAECLNW